MTTKDDSPKVRFVLDAPPAKLQEATLADFLKSGLEQMSLSLSAQAEQKILSYIELMIKWNRAYNLTSVREPTEIMIRHIFDSLSIGHHLQGEQILDVGTGAGLPGIPLALAYPDKYFTLIDSNGKKTRFLFNVLHTLHIPNIYVVNERVEGYQKFNELKEGMRLRRFDTIVSRAFSSLREMLYNTEHLCQEKGVFLAMKGVYPLTELHEIPQGFKVKETLPLKVPYMDAERHLVKIVFDDA
ncbi:16S rRNA (guanine(527)-N(7))-methyltransferase RsmG [Candidatus Dependentiae bacterium]|nr:16S rRNA (guanine(527)-N(7))-methyltransferase RsmG [Candidatus Dependentiae bacterium]